MQLDPQLMARMLMGQQPQQQGNFGSFPGGDQQLFQAPPGAGTTLPPIVDPNMARSPSTLPGDYSRMPFQYAPFAQPGLFGQ